MSSNECNRCSLLLAFFGFLSCFGLSVAPGPDALGVVRSTGLPPPPAAKLDALQNSDHTVSE